MIAVLCLAVVAGVGAEEVELDPLLELLVEQGVITIEQALAVQAEYDRRRATENAPAVMPPPVVPDQRAVAAEAAPPPAEEK